MPTLTRTLADDVLRFRLDEEAFHLGGAHGLARSGRAARTLLKDGPARLTMVALGAGESIPPHDVAGPVTLLPVWGGIRVLTGDEVHFLEPGDLLALGADVEHSIESLNGGIFLLAVSTCVAARGGEAAA
jgi:quercetin dioxygenase-like cupin family protein